MDYTVGQRLRLKQHLGYDPAITEEHPKHPRHLGTATVIDDQGNEVIDGTHLGMHPLFAGQVATVVGHAPASETGKAEDTVILEHEHRQFVRHGQVEVPAADGGVAYRPDPDNPVHVEGNHTRHIAHTPAQLDELYEPVEGGA